MFQESYEMVTFSFNFLHTLQNLETVLEKPERGYWTHAHCFVQGIKVA